MAKEGMLERRIDELENQIRSLLETQGEESKRLEERINQLDKRVAILEQRDENYRSILKSFQDNQNRIIMALISLVAALVGKEAIVSSFGHTPPIEIIAYWIVGAGYAATSLYLLYLGLQKPRLRILVFISALLMLIATLIRFDLGHECVGMQYPAILSILLILSAFSFLLEAVLRCLKR